MNSQEQSLLPPFLDQLKAIRGITKDPEADRLINRAEISKFGISLGEVILYIERLEQ